MRNALTTGSHQSPFATDAATVGETVEFVDKQHAGRQKPSSIEETARCLDHFTKVSVVLKEIAYRKGDELHAAGLRDHLGQHCLSGAARPEDQVAAV